ncbi:Zinc Finger C2H2-type Transcription Regulator [Pleurotus pulmonarius]
MPSFECSVCDRQFRSFVALSDHCRSTAHGAWCMPCQRFFVNDQSLSQHINASPKHAFDSDDSSEVYSSDDDETSSEEEDDEEPYCQGCSRWFVNVMSLHAHLRDSPLHNWCFQCSRDFSTNTALNQHTQSLAHKDRDLQCPFCRVMFKSPSGVAFHVESGCHKINRHQVTAAVHALGIVPTISVNRRLQGSSNSFPTTLTTYIATEASFNGSKYDCYLCNRKFRTLSGLNAHLNSPAHDKDEFKCPKCKREFKLISGLVQHIESGVCKVAQLKKVEAYYEDLTAAFTRALKL